MSLQIFLFHGINKKNEVVEEGHRNIHISDHRFRSFLQDLKDHSNPLTMNDVVDYCSKKKEFPKESFAITFDDGFENNYSIAAPILEELSIPATIYVSTALIDENKNYMSWSQVRELAENPNFLIGGHSHDHLDLAKLNKNELESQISTSLKLLKKIGVSPKHYAYPYGQIRHYNNNVIKCLIKNGVICCPTAKAGINNHNDNLFELKRISIS